MVRLKYLQYFIITLVVFSCQKEKNDDPYTVDVFQSLEANTALVAIKIDNKEFYSEESLFIPTTTIGAKYIALNLVDQFGGNLQLQISRSNWSEDVQAPFLISPTMEIGYTDYGTFLIGKRNTSSIEGYILSKGKFNWLKFTESEAVLKCEGFVLKPQDASIKENEIPFSGLIYLKAPTIVFKNIQKKDIFK